jgi:hypothetical protein
MAKATPKTRTVEKIVKEEVKDGITLTLSHEEALTLIILAASVSGDTTKSARKYADNICIALRSVGYDWEQNNKFWKHRKSGNLQSGNLHFNEGLE